MTGFSVVVAFSRTVGSGMSYRLGGGCPGVVLPWVVALCSVRFGLDSSPTGTYAPRVCCAMAVRLPRLRLCLVPTHLSGRMAARNNAQRRVVNGGHE